MCGTTGDRKVILLKQVPPTLLRQSLLINYLMADVLFATQPLQDDYEDHERRHLRSLTHHVGLYI